VTPTGHIRPWRLNCAVSALRAAFPGAKVHIRYYDPRAGFAGFVVSQSVTITNVRELLSLKTSWAPRRLRIAAEVLNACEHEAAITALIAGVVPMMQRGTVIAVGPSGEHGADADPVTEVVALAEQPRPIQRGPRLGRRVDPEELPQRLRGAVVRVARLGKEVRP